MQSSFTPRLHLRIEDPALAARMASGNLYVRSHAFDFWDDGAWEPSVKGGQWFRDVEDGAADGLTNLRPGPPEGVKHRLFLDDTDGFSLPALQGVRAYGLPEVFGDPSDLYRIDDGVAIQYEAVSEPLFWDQLPDRSKLRAGAATNNAQTARPAGQAFAQLVYGDPLLRPANAGSLENRINNLRQWFRNNVRYSTVMETKGHLSPMMNFLIGEQEGYCDFYAAAGALILRYSGVPTRVAFGYAGNEYDSTSNIFTFTDNQAHAWTEILVEGRGWVICDFTPPENVGHLKEEKPKTAEPFDESKYRKVDPPPKTEPEKKDGQSLAAWVNDMAKKLMAMDPLEALKEILKWALPAALLFVLIWWLARRGKKAAEEKDTFAADGEQPAYFAEFVRVFREAGCPRLAGSTPREYFSAVQSRGLAGPEFTPMISYHYSRRYMEEPPDRRQEAEWLTLVRETEKRLKQQQTAADAGQA